MLHCVGILFMRNSDYYSGTVKVPPIAQLFNGMGLVGVCGFDDSFLQKKKVQVFEAPREQLGW